MDDVHEIHGTGRGRRPGNVDVRVVAACWLPAKAAAKTDSSTRTIVCVKVVIRNDKAGLVYFSLTRLGVLQKNLKVETIDTCDCCFHREFLRLEQCDTPSYTLCYSGHIILLY